MLVGLQVQPWSAPAFLMTADPCWAAGGPGPRRSWSRKRGAKRALHAAAVTGTLIRRGGSLLV